MKLPKEITTVTPFSKVVALILFIALPILFFVIGMNYETNRSVQDIPSPDFNATNMNRVQNTEVSTFNDGVISFTYPHNWQESPVSIQGSSSTIRLDDVEGIYSVEVIKHANYNNGNGAKYKTMAEFISTASVPEPVQVDGVDIYKIMGRAGSENTEQALFFTPDKKNIYQITVTTNRQKDTIAIPQIHMMNKLLSTLKFSIPINNETDTPMSKIQTCPDEWYDNQMPCSGECTQNRMYFIIKGKRVEYDQVDVDWVKSQCSVKPQIVY